jgi:hypothetical protein
MHSHTCPSHIPVFDCTTKRSKRAESRDFCASSGSIEMKLRARSRRSLWGCRIEPRAPPGAMVASTMPLLALCFLCLSLNGTLSFDYSYRARYRGSTAATHLRQAAKESSTSSTKTEEEVREEFKTSIERTTHSSQLTAHIFSKHTSTHTPSSPTLTTR